jgi:hypothetical protein
LLLTVIGVGGAVLCGLGAIRLATGQVKRGGVFGHSALALLLLGSALLMIGLRGIGLPDAMPMQFLPFFLIILAAVVERRARERVRK